MKNFASVYRNALLSCLLAASTLLTGCISAPQLPVPLTQSALAPNSGKVGVAMAVLPKVETSYPGAGCLLCYAAAAAANASLSSHADTLKPDDFNTLKEEVAAVLKARGVDVVIVPAVLAIKDLPSFSAEGNFARKDFASLKQKLGVDRLVVINITELGFIRTYANYFPTSDPKAYVVGQSFLVNLSNNALDWYTPLDLQKGSDSKWDEPPKFPGLTNAYYQVVELTKDAILKPLKK
ncbi:hypothetical protein [Viridibacterium curvum]|uniref:Lipoprotein n=1 Tax=Viridibacterium curvum TaxID=1101404 RepID=A0ABP9QNE7_9RHOO